MNDESRRIISQYKTQIIVLLFTLVSVIISILVVIDLIKVEKGVLPKNFYKTRYKSRASSLIVLLSAFYLTYSAYDAYKRSKTKSNFAFLVAALLALVSAAIRYIEINKNSEIEGAEDII